MAKEVAAAQSKRRVQSIEVGFRVLRVLRMAEGPLPLREIAMRAEMPPSKVHLYLVSFVREDMAYQDPETGHYGLGGFAIQLGLAAIRQLDVVTLAADVLDDLCNKTKCAIYLALWGDQGPCIVAKADGEMQGAFAIRLGYILPLAGSSTGRVFVAHLPKKDTSRVLSAQSAYVKRIGTNLSTTRKELEEGAAEALKRGYASSTGRLHQNFAAISVPIFDFSGALAAVMTLLGPVDYVNGPHNAEFTRQMVEAGHDLSQRLGAPPPADKAV
jgi:DNA-binding IclR family transcriptional regulator